MRRLALIALTSGLLAAAPAAAAPPVQVMVVGKTKVLRGPVDFATFKPTSVRVAGRRCNVLGATPLALLVRTKLSLRMRDLGSCGRNARDAGSIYVSQVGAERERGRGGWVYKVGHRTGTTGAGDPSGPFGTGRRLRSGQRVLWFWCELSAGDVCQRTLDARVALADGRVRVTVRGYDDNGKGVPVPGATVTYGAASATTDAAGVAVFDRAATAQRVVAAKDGMVRSFPVRVAAP